MRPGAQECALDGDTRDWHVLLASREDFVRHSSANFMRAEVVESD